MDEKEIQEKTFKGLRWSIILSSMSFPAGYLTMIILGRLSPEALGTYGLIGLLTNIILGLVYFGGNAVIIKFVPMLPKNKFFSFLVTYTGLVSLIAGIFCLVAWFSPEYIGFFQKKITFDLYYKYLVLFTFILILQSILLATLRAFLNIKASIILSKIITFGTFGINLFLFFYYRTFFLNNFSWLLWFVYLGLLSASGILGLYFLLNQMEKFNFRNISLFLPDGFWKFAVPFQLASAITIFQTNFDQMFVILLFGLKDYGKYLAVLNTVIVIQLISNIFLEVMFPSFSNMVALNNTALLRKTYYATAKYFSLFFGILSLFFIFRGDLLLSLFGKGYLHMGNIMVIIAASVGLTSLSGINSMVFSATGLTKYTLVLSVIELLILFLFGLILYKKFGMVGIAMAKGISLVCRSGISIYITSKYLNLGLNIPKAYWVKVLLVIGGATLTLIYPPEGQLISSLLMFIFMAGLLFFGGIEEEDLRLAKRIVYGKPT